MSTLEDLRKKAIELRNKGLTTQDIANELNLQIDTVTWLLLHEKQRRKTPTPFDFSVNWSSIGCSPKRLNLISSALADLASEAVEAGQFEPFDVVLGVELPGSPLGYVVAEKLEKPYAVVRTTRVEGGSEADEESIMGALSTNFSTVENKRVLLVADVISTGVVLAGTIKSLRQTEAEPVGIVVLADKRGIAELAGVPVKSLINLIALKK
ncbi:MAG: orotate phosphoribosyltransferase-like protein [Candidatus Bathyarchaeia archaeon]